MSPFREVIKHNLLVLSTPGILVNNSPREELSVDFEIDKGPFLNIVISLEGKVSGGGA